jgi:hypothetical protein
VPVKALTQRATSALVWINKTAKNGAKQISLICGKWHEKKVSYRG